METHVYRRTPVEVNAIQYDGDNAEEVKDFIRLTGKDVDQIIVGAVDGSYDDLFIETNEGVFHVEPDDFIIYCKISNEFYPCNPDIFAEKYELVR